MKIRIVILVFIFLCSNTFAQTRNTVSLVYDFTTTNTATYGATSTDSYKIEAGMRYGLTYTRSISKQFAIGAGFIFVDNKSQLSAPPGGPPGTLYTPPGSSTGVVNANGDVKMLEIPFFARFTFLRYLFIEAGVSIDSQTNYQSYASENSTMFEQSGVGFEIGLGGKYDFKRFSISASPFLFNHYVFYIGRSSSNNKLEETGIRLAAGYSF